MLPGTSVTYYGEEIGMTDSCAEFSYDAEHKREYPAKSCDASKAEKWGDTWTRSPMQWDDTTNGGFTADPEPWIPIGNHYKTVNVKAQEGQPKSHLEIHRSLLQLRKNKAITDSDKFEMKTLNTNSFAFKRLVKDFIYCCTLYQLFTISVSSTTRKQKAFWFLSTSATKQKRSTSKKHSLACPI